MKNFYHLVFGLFIVSVLFLCGCTADSTSGQPSDETPSTAKEMGFIISLNSFGRAYYTREEVSYFKVQVSLGSNVVAEERANLSEPVTITLTEEGLYTIAVIAYNSNDTAIADGSTQKELYSDSGYQHISVSITPYTKPSSGIIVDVDWIDPDTADMVLVEGGTFQMGGTKYNDEQPVHEVTVSSFYMSKYEVTQAEWGSVMGTTLSDIISENGWSSYGIGDNYPMYYVSWYDAVNYCNKRSVAEGLTACYTINGNNVTCNWSANGYRLPTEAEWEYAARGGKHKSAFEYSGSDNIDEVAWYSSNSGSGTHEVGKKNANALGIYDMSGNVWEWCWDWYGGDYYGSSVGNNPVGPASGSYRVLRGGSWCYDASRCRCANRYNRSPDCRSSDLGFRVVRSYK